MHGLADAKRAVTFRVVGAYSLVGAAFALPLSRRWRLKSFIEANLYVPSLVSASIEPSAKIL